MLRFNNDVLILSGKYKGKRGYVMYLSTPASRSVKNRYAVRLQSGRGWVTILINEDNLEKKNDTYIAGCA